MSRPSRSAGWLAVFLVTGVCVGLRPGPVAAEEKSPGKKAEPPIKRRAQTTEEELRKELQSVPEAGFNQQDAKELYTPIIKTMKAQPPLKNLPPELGLLTLQEKAARDDRLDMVFLPWLAGADSELIKEEAVHLQALSTQLRTALLKSSVGREKRDDRPDPEKLLPLLKAPEWKAPGAVPTLTQMLQAEPTGVRLLLVEMLAKIDGREASIALARRAIFDLSPEVRAWAVRALADRPASEYTPVLYEAFRYPWPAAADHAAEAVAELKRIDLIPELVKLLKEPSPTLPLKSEGGYTVQEVVRVNHLCNCMLCHAPSLEKSDLVRGGAPIPGERFDSRYSRGSGSLFVRADLTYLRQDFSVAQPVAKPDKWPGEQRYDYLVRTRPLSKAEQAAFEKLVKEDKVPKSYPQQAAVVFALQELTGRDHGTTYESWSAGLRESGTQTAKPRDKP